MSRLLFALRNARRAFLVAWRSWAALREVELGRDEAPSPQFCPPPVTPCERYAIRPVRGGVVYQVPREDVGRFTRGGDA